MTPTPQPSADELSLPDGDSKQRPDGAEGRWADRCLATMHQTSLQTVACEHKVVFCSKVSGRVLGEELLKSFAELERKEQRAVQEKEQTAVTVPSARLSQEGSIAVNRGKRSRPAEAYVGKYQQQYVGESDEEDDEFAQPHPKKSRKDDESGEPGHASARERSDRAVPSEHEMQAAPEHARDVPAAAAKSETARGKGVPASNEQPAAEQGTFRVPKRVVMGKIVGVCKDNWQGDPPGNQVTCTVYPNVSDCFCTLRISGEAFIRCWFMCRRMLLCSGCFAQQYHDDTTCSIVCLMH